MSPTETKSVSPIGCGCAENTAASRAPSVMEVRRQAIEATLQNLIPIAVVVTGGCEPCAEKTVTRALEQGTAWHDIDLTLRILAHLRTLDCLAEGIGPETVARMEKPIAAGQRTLRLAIDLAGGRIVTEVGHDN